MRSWRPQCLPRWEMKSSDNWYDLREPRNLRVSIIAAFAIATAQQDPLDKKKRKRQKNKS